MIAQDKRTEKNCIGMCNKILDGWLYDPLNVVLNRRDFPFKAVIPYSLSARPNLCRCVTGVMVHVQEANVQRLPEKRSQNCCL